MDDHFGLEEALLLPALYQAVQWRLAELLESPHSVREIASSLGIEQAQVDETVTLLLQHGYFRLNGEQHVARTMRSSQLLPSAPFASFVRAYGSPANVHLWAGLSHALAPENQPSSNPLLSWLQEHPAAYNAHQHVQQDLRDPFAQQLLQQVDFSHVQTIVSVGGGRGSVLVALLQQQRHLHCLLIDDAAAIEDARERLGRGGVLSRCTLRVGPLSDAPLPSKGEGEVYLLYGLLQDADDAQFRDVLRTCRSRMEPEMRLLIVDLLWRTGDESAAFLDLQSLLEGKQGRLRTEAEINALLTASGFARTRSITLSNSSMTLVEGVAV